MERPSVSVVIPVYNNAPYIAAAVQSVLSQTRQPDEIIVVDDGSTDGTAKALEQFRGEIRYVYQQNRGEPAARNRGISESKYAFVAFLDGDDLWREDKLELQMRYLEEHPGCSLVYSDMSTFDEKGEIDASVKTRLRMSMPSGRIFPALFERSLFGSGTVIFRKTCVATVGNFDENLLVGSDYEMWLRISRNFDVGAVDQPLLMYRHHATMSTRGLGLRMRNGVPWEVEVISKILKLYPEAIDELGRSTVKRRMSKPYAGVAYARVRQDDPKNARPLLRKAIACWPTNGWYWTLYGATFLNPTQIAATRKLYRKFTQRTA
jgi:glycosyltransferase involved in cell wall biosynthesis